MRAACGLLLLMGCGEVLDVPTDAGLDSGPNLHRVRVTVSGDGRVYTQDGALDCGERCETRWAGPLVLIAEPGAGQSVGAWSIAGCSGTECSVTVAAPVDVTVSFAPPLATLTVSTSGDGEGAVLSMPEGVDCGASCEAGFAPGTQVTLTALPAGDATFGGWSGDCAGMAAVCQVEMNADKSVGAAFDRAQRTLTVALAGQGAGRVTSDVGALDCPGVCSTSLARGTTVELTATAEPGSVFAGWSQAGCSGLGSCSVQLDAATSVTARFDVQTHILTVQKAGPGDGLVTSTPPGIDCGSTCSAPFSHDTVVTLDVTPIPAVRFERWDTACTGPTCQVTMTGSATATARFERVPQLSTNGSHNCALKPDGTLRCWGFNMQGQLGLGHTNNIGDDELPSSQPPVNVPPTIRQVCNGGNHSCVLFDGGQLNCWGYNFFGQLARDDSVDRTSPPAANIPLGANARALACGAFHNCAVTPTDGLRCWGRGDFGQLGHGCPNNLGDGGAACASLNDDVPVAAPVKSVALGAYHMCAVTTADAVRCWGRNDDGQLGYGHFDNVGDDPGELLSLDVPLPGFVASVAAGVAHTCALLTSGMVYCWGAGHRGQLGNGSSDGSASPVLAGVGVDLVSLTAGQDFTCGWTAGGSARCWGYAAEGRLGGGNTNNLGDDPLDAYPNLPLIGARYVGAGGAHSCALLDTEIVTCWGRANEGQLGYGNQDSIGGSPGSAAGSGGPVSF